ncbi:hypothetical protein BHM03_00003485 [Ensete ventricosum]|nr:hypothetical protein BHM03_00003485 [Ensete ventricosum]
MSGRNAKTNFPVHRASEGEDAAAAHSSSKALAEVLSAKLRKCCKTTPSPSLTCLRLDTEKSHIGVWQKRAGTRADSSWVMTVELGSVGSGGQEASEATMAPSPLAGKGTSSQEAVGEMDDEERLALQMIEELLSRNRPTSSSSHAGMEDQFIHFIIHRRIARPNKSFCWDENERDLVWRSNGNDRRHEDGVCGLEIDDVSTAFRASGRGPKDVSRWSTLIACAP